MTCTMRALAARPANSTVAAGTVKSSTRVDLGEQLQRIIGDDDAELAEAGQQAGVLAERQRALLLDGAGKTQPSLSVDRADQLAPHAAGGARHGNLEFFHVRVRLPPPQAV